MSRLLRARIHLILGVLSLVWSGFGEAGHTYFFAILIVVVVVVGALEIVRRRWDANTLREVEASQERYHAQKEAEHRAKEAQK